MWEFSGKEGGLPRSFLASNLNQKAMEPCLKTRCSWEERGQAPFPTCKYSYLEFITFRPGPAACLLLLPPVDETIQQISGCRLQFEFEDCN